MRPGFKDTEVGEIPEDWDVTSVGQLVAENILDKPLDGNHGNIHPKSDEFVAHGVPFIMANNLSGGRVDTETCVFITKKQADSLQKGFARQGDVLLTHKATIGQTAIVGTTEFGYLMLTPQVTYYRVTRPDALLNTFLRHYFDSHSFQLTLRRLAGGGTRAYIGITGQLALPVLIPSTHKEQQAIAGALSDADALIESLENLIEKKRMMKQGAMQSLLTGKKRLPGFTGDWIEKKLGDVARIQRGASPRPIESPEWFDSSSNVGWVRISDVTSAGMFLDHTTQKLSSRGIRHSRPVERGGLIMSICATVGRPIITRIDTCIHDGFVHMDNLLVDKAYLYYCLCFIQNDWSKAGQTGSQMNLNTGLINNKVIGVAPTESEQIEIGNYLISMDGEIDVLSAKLEKAKQIKQGMMQQLLTGKIRLI